MKLTSSKAPKLSGKITVAGDKSISHRSLIIASQAIGISEISGLLEGEDVIATAEALKKLGADIKKVGDKWVVNGAGVGSLQATNEVLDMGNSGTGVRLLMGLVGAYGFNTKFTGDESLRSRPMDRVTIPLSKMGINFQSNNNKLPLTVEGLADCIPIEYELPVASAQVKSAILLAGLNTDGETTVIEPELTRDHTELMLKSFGADIRREGDRIILKGRPELIAQNINVPGDPSSAAFPIAAALIVPDSEIIVENICLNPQRIGLYITLKEMGADIEFLNERLEGGDKVADIKVKYSKLNGVTVPAERAPSMIDEYPILAVIAAFAQGETKMLGLKELKVKESDRLKAIYDGLTANGVKSEMGDEDLTVHGGAVLGGGEVKTHLDHRIAMSFLIMGLASQKPISVDDGEPIKTSFPNFIQTIESIAKTSTIK